MGALDCSRLKWKTIYSSHLFTCVHRASPECHLPSPCCKQQKNQVLSAGRVTPRTLPEPLSSTAFRNTSLQSSPSNELNPLLGSPFAIIPLPILSGKSHMVLYSGHLMNRDDPVTQFSVFLWQACTPPLKQIHARE